ncbi:Mobile element protein [uncultured Gammaproteobacteria bacterium]|nr:Mobile element protein [uncultured Gammaproteobacteria bacterium]
MSVLVLQFKRNPYYQYFCGYSNYMPGMPCNATELVHFRKRIGVKGFNLIFRDLCINRNNHQKPTFHPLGNFLNPALALLGQGLKKSPIGQKLDFLIIPICAKVSLSKYYDLYKTIDFADKDVWFFLL